MSLGTGGYTEFARRHMTLRPATPHSPSRLRGAGRGLIVLTVWLVVIAGAATPCGAHSKLVQSVPADRSVVGESPSRVRLWFNERIEPSYAELSVREAGGKQVDAGDIAVDPTNGVAMSVGIPRVPPGIYSVRYRVVSVDGHVVKGNLTFTVKSPRGGK